MAAELHEDIDDDQNLGNKKFGIVFFVSYHLPFPGLRALLPKRKKNTQLTQCLLQFVAEVWNLDFQRSKSLKNRKNTPVVSAG
jgi:hypothetical protein